jgi:ribosomal protein S18 acetylase RimI-like enzyme
LFGNPGLALRAVVLRAAKDSDRPFLRALFETARIDAGLLAAWPDDVRRLFLDQQFHFQTVHYARAYPHAECSVVMSAGQPIGRLIVDRTHGEWCIVDIALLPPWRGRSIGTLLMQSVQFAAKDAKAGCIRLTVDMTNPARRLYERLGFTVEQECAPALAMIWRTGSFQAVQLNTA